MARRFVLENVAVTDIDMSRSSRFREDVTYRKWAFLWLHTGGWSLSGRIRDVLNQSTVRVPTPEA